MFDAGHVLRFEYRSASSTLKSSVQSSHKDTSYEVEVLRIVNDFNRHAVLLHLQCGVVSISNVIIFHSLYKSNVSD